LLSLIEYDEYGEVLLPSLGSFVTFPVELQSIC
jgi:hypothetical protein